MMAFGVAFAVAVLLTGALIPILREVGLVDVPNGRSSHVTPTPRGGGVAVVSAVLVAVCFSGNADPEVWAPVTTAVVLAVVGLIDDARSLSSRVRLIAQVVAATTVSAFVLQMATPMVWLPFAFAVAIFGIVGYVNAFNFMDGVNAISGLNAGLAGIWFAWLGWSQDIPSVEFLGTALAGGALGFLPWNVRRRVFLGDSGSYGLGALISVTAVFTWLSDVPPLLVLAPIAIYLGDTGWTMAGRARSRQHVTQAHRGHVYQRLVRNGWGHLSTAAWTVLFAILSCLVAAALHGSFPVLTGLMMFILVVLYLSSPKWLPRPRTVNCCPGNCR